MNKLIRIVLILKCLVVPNILADYIIIQPPNITNLSYPWPPELHWLHPYLNLSSLSEEYMDGLVLGVRFTYEIHNYTNAGKWEWSIDIRTDPKTADPYYYKHYNGTGNNMFMCTPNFPYRIDLLPKETTNEDLARCYNYTPGMWDHVKRRAEWSYIWETYKVKLVIVFVSGASITLTGLFGNLMIMWSILRYKDMRSATNYFLASLALDDLLVTLILPAYAIRMGYFRYFNFIRETVHGCRFLPFFEKWLFLTSVFHLTAVSFERFFAICYPMKVKTICTTRRAKLVIPVLWIIAMVCAVPDIIPAGEVRIDSGYGCAIRGSYMHGWYYIHRSTEFILFYLVPFGLIVHNYPRLSYSLVKSLRQNAELMEGNQLQNQRTNEDARKRLKVVKMLVVIIIIFFVCWTPRLMFHLIYSLKIKIRNKSFIFRDELRIWLELLSYVNSSVNAFIYYLTSDQFNKAFKRMLSCGRFGGEEGAKAKKPEVTSQSAQRKQEPETISRNDQSPIMASIANGN